MHDVLDYYLAGGRIIIGKREMALELLRKDSVLRVLLGYGAGNPASLASRADVSDGDPVVVDFNGREKLRLDGDPTPMLNELKARYGGKVGGELNFQCIYATFWQVLYINANLDAVPIVLR